MKKNFNLSDKRKSRQDNRNCHSYKGGSALGHSKYIRAAIVFAVTAIISLGGLIGYKHICNKNKEELKRNGTT